MKLLQNKTSIMISILVLVLIIFYLFDNKNKPEKYTLLDKNISIKKKIINTQENLDLKL